MRTSSQPPAASPGPATDGDVPIGDARLPPPGSGQDGAPAGAAEPRTGWRARSVGDGTFDRPPPVDLLAAVVVGLALLAELIAGELQGTVDAMVPGLVGGVLVVVIAVPLAWRRVTPVLTMAVTGTAIGAFTLLGYGLGLAGLALVLALYSVAAYGTREDARVSLAITAGFVLAGFGAAWWRTGELEVIGFVVTALVLTGVFALGDRTRARRQLVAQLEVRAEEAERHQRMATALAAADERRRIARELHDVVAHTVSVVVVQAGAGRRVAERDPDAAAAVLADIEASGRDALVELRRLVRVLRDDEQGEGHAAPQPTLEAVPGLVARLADAGVPVRLQGDEPGAAAVASGVAVSAYRIVQESLTNVLKHAGPVTEVVVTIQRRDDVLRLTVVDDGRGRTPPAAPPDPAPLGAGAPGTRAGRGADLAASGAGTGLLGMRERAAILGGQLWAGSRPEGGFKVVAELPLSPAAEGHHGGPPAAAAHRGPSAVDGEEPA